MEEGAKSGSGSSELETLVLEKVGEVSAAIDAAKHVDEVICALYSLAVRIFPVDSSALRGSISDPSHTIDPAHRSKVHEILSPAPAESGEWRQAFYYGPAFPTLARILIYSRLESPINLVRKMASSVALVFSKVVDPKNPLYLDDDCSEIIDWEFGFKRKDVVTTYETIKDKLNATLSKDTEKDKLDATLSKVTESASHAKRLKDTKHHAVDGGKLISECRVDHCAGMPNNEHASAEEDDDEGKNSDASSSDSLEPYDLSDDDTDMKVFSQLGDIAAALRKPDDPDGVERALDSAEKLVRATPDELPHYSGDLVRALVHVRCSDVTVEGEEDSAEGKRQKALVALLVTCPFESLDVLTRLLYSPNVDVSQRILILDVMTEAAQELSESTVIRMKHQQRNLISNISGQPWFIPSSRGPPGAGRWKEVSDPGTSISWSHRYEREIPSRAGQIKSGKSRKWGLVKAKDPELESSRNRFPLYAAAFMLPVMQGFDKKRHGVDLLNRDFVVLGKLIYMLGVCMKCSTMHPEASALAPPLLDMIRFR
ncbi:hypothetical protein BHM03_00011940 [Ensete ventricosum]|nr:hypothetical protein BHM03_00011940 [Ensete ventricosum]